MQRQYETTGNANLRSTPNVGADTNILVQLPAGHWLNLIGLEHRDWAEVWTIFRNRRYRGFVHTTLIVRVATDAPSDVLPPSITYRGKLFTDQESQELKRFLSITPPSQDAKASETLSIHRSREVEIEWDEVLSGRILPSYGLPPIATAFVSTANFSHFASYFIKLWNLSSTNYGAQRPNLCSQRAY